MSLFYLCPGNGWRIIVLWNTGPGWLDRYKATNLPGCVFALVGIFGGMCLVLIQKNGDCEVEASFTENEVASSNATGLTYCNVEWKQQPDKRRK
jgi:hypothetical protein